MGNEIVKVSPQTWEMIPAIAPTMHAARLFGVASPEQAAAIMLKGSELGLSLTASFEMIHMINGKPSISPKGALALILQSPECAGVQINDEPGKCTVTMKRRGGLEYTSVFTIEDAKKAGLIKTDSGWDKYPANMLRWRAIGFCADVVFPDVIGGMRRSDDMGAPITEDGEVITVEARPIITLETLVERYGAEAVLEANGGTIPATDEDVANIAEVLDDRAP
jgi:hypothetical protein